MILARHILREHIAPFIYSLVTITGLFLIDFVVQVLDSILSKGLPWRVVLELFVLNMAWILALSVPMSVLVATLMAFGRMSADREIDAMRAAGLHPVRMLSPVLAMGVLLSIGLFFFNNEVLPRANYRAASLREDISRKRPAIALQPRTMIQDFEGFRIWIDRVDKGTDSLRGISIHQLDVGGAPTVITARAGTVALADSGRVWQFELRHGETHSQDRQDPKNYMRTVFRSLRVDVPNIDSRLNRTEKGFRGDREMNVEEMGVSLKVTRDRERGIVEEAEERLLSDLRDEISLLASDSASGPMAVTAGSSPGFDLNQAPREAVEKFMHLCFARERDAEITVAQISGERHEQARYLVEIHKKFSIPVACVVFILVGVPLGVMARSGGIGTGVSYSLAFFIAYWACLIGGESQADRLRIPPWLAMWFPNMLLGLLGLFLVTRMGHQSQFFRYGWLRLPWRRKAPAAVTVTEIVKSPDPPPVPDAVDEDRNDGQRKDP
jgi:lipopolysaccharide export system permease protein